jgi:hypothetical protein
MMSDIQGELNKRIINCIKRETGIDLLNQETISELNQESSAIISEYGFKCALKIFRSIAKAKFKDWLLDEFNKIENDAEKVGNRIIRFSSKINDPVDVFTELNLLSNIFENLIDDIDDTDIFSDTKSLLRLLAITSLSGVRNNVFINSLRPQLFTMELAQHALGKDNSWCASMLALTIEEQFVKKKVSEFGISIGENEDYYSILKKLTKYLEENNIRQNRDLFLLDSHRKIRNNVLHENWNPTEDEMDDIIAHVLKVINYLNSMEI